jgi:hypothetical protein
MLFSHILSEFLRVLLLLKITSVITILLPKLICVASTAGAFALFSGVIELVIYSPG